MTTTTKHRVRPADTIHFLSEHPMTLSTGDGDIDLIPISTYRGLTVVLTDAMIRNTEDRNGASWLDLIDDAAAQESKWGEQMFARGAFPEGLDRFKRGSTLAFEERERLREAAKARLTGAELSAELRAIDARTGRPDTTGTTTHLDGGLRG